MRLAIQSEKPLRNSGYGTKYAAFAAVPMVESTDKILEVGLAQAGKRGLILHYRAPRRAVVGISSAFCLTKVAENRTAIRYRGREFPSPIHTEELTMKQQAMTVAHAALNPPAGAKRTLRAFAGVAASVLIAQSAMSAEVILSCVWQSRGPVHEKRAFEITIDQQMQRAQVSGNFSLPASISPTRVTFNVNLSGSIFQYTIDRTSGFGSVTIKDEVVYSGMCSIMDPAHRAL